MGILISTTGLPLLTASGAISVAVPPDEVVESTTLAPLIGDMDIVQTAYVDESLPLDFSDHFSGTITGISPSIPHTIDGQTIRIEPTATSSAATYTISSGAESVQIEIKAVAAPAALAGTAVPDQSVEVERPMRRIEWYRYHTGGIPPYTYQQTAGPSWVITRAGGTRGVAPSTTAVTSVTVRVTDQRGDTVDLSCSIAVIALRSRTPTRTMTGSHASIAAAISQAPALGSGDVLFIPASLGPVAPGSISVDIAEGLAPLIIRGETGSTVAAPMDVQNDKGLSFENLTFEFQSVPAHNTWAAKGGERCDFIDCRFEGVVDAINPNDGQDWQTDETFVYEGSGLWMGERSIAYRCVADKVEEAWNPRGLHLDCETLNYRDDAMIVEGNHGCAIVGYTCKTERSSNRLGASHPDLLQAFTVTQPQMRHWEVWDCFTTAEGHPMQGWWITYPLTNWNARARDLDQMWQHVHIGHCVVLAGQWNAFSFQRWYNAIVENCIILLHPDADWNEYDARVRHWHVSKVTLRNCIFASLDDGQGDATAPGYMHLITQQNNTLLPQTNRGAYEDVFPDWESTGMATLDRVRIDPAWAAAHANVGPSWLVAEPPPAPAPANTVAPSVSGNNWPGQTLSRSTGTWTDAETYATQWRNNGSSISGATGSTYAVQAGDLGDVIDCTVTATGPGGTSSPVASSNSKTIVEEPEIEPFDTGDLQTASSIAHRGVTFNFSAPVTYYTTANGDPVVFSQSPYMGSGGVNITSISPASSSGANGAMIDPLIEATTSTTDPSSLGSTFDVPGVIGEQGFDTAINGSGDGTAPIPYNSARNVDPGATGSAIAIAQNAQMCVMKSVRASGASTSTGRVVDKYVPLTIVNTLPPVAAASVDGKNGWFRPGVGVRTWAHRLDTLAANVDYANGFANGVLQNLSTPSGAENVSSRLTKLLAQNLQHLPLWADGQGDRLRRLLNYNEDPQVGNVYATYIARERMKHPVSLHMATSTQAAHDDRLDMCVHIAQWAIDGDATAQRGEFYHSGAGQQWGTQTWPYYGAFFFGDEEMLERAKLMEGNAINQHWWVDENHVALPVKNDSGSEGGGGRVGRVPYWEEDIGKPEWSGGGWNGNNPAAQYTTQISANLHALYRESQFTVLIYELMPVGLLQNGDFPSYPGLTGDAAIRDGEYSTSNQRASAIGYMDRSMTFSPWELVDLNAHNTDSKAVFNAWRASVPQPQWEGLPDANDNPYSYPMFSAGGSSGQVAFDHSGIDYCTGTLAERKVEVSQDFGTDAAIGAFSYQFVDVADINASNAVGTSDTKTLVGLRPGTARFRVQQRNEHGWGRKTQTWPMVRQDSANSQYFQYQGAPNQVTVPGTASGTLTRVVDPVILYKPSSVVPYFLPVTDADPYEVDTLYCGMGYWTGGTGSLSATYQWQRSTDGSTGWANISGATGKSYSRTSGDLNRYIRCTITVNGSAFNTASVYWPAADTFPSTTLMQTNFNSMFPFEWSSANPTATGGQYIHEPDSLYDGTDPEYRGGIWCDKDGGTAAVQIQARNASAGVTYRYKIVVSYAQRISNNNSFSRPPNGNYVLKISTASGGGGTAFLNQTVSYATYGTDSRQVIYEDTFTPGSASSVYVHFQSNSSGILGAPGLLYVEIKQNGT